MKRIIILLIFIFTILLSDYYARDMGVLKGVNANTNGYYSYYSNINIFSGNLHILDNANLHIMSFGEFVIVKDYFDINNFIEINKLEIISIDNVDEYNVKLYVLYSNRLPKYRILHNKKYNIQVAISQKVIKIGYPAIFDSF